MCPLPLYCSDDSQKCDEKYRAQKKHKEKKTMKKTLIWKHDISFLNFRSSITFTIITTF